MLPEGAHRRFIRPAPHIVGSGVICTGNDQQLADELIAESFGDTNMVALVIPAGDYEKERKLINDLEARTEVDYCQGLANTEAMDGYMLTDKLTARDFSELLELDYEVSELLYMAYAVNDENYAKIVNGISSYSVPLIDMFMFLYDEVDEGYVTLDDDMHDTLEDAHEKMQIALDQHPKLAQELQKFYWLHRLSASCAASGQAASRRLNSGVV